MKWFALTIMAFCAHVTSIYAKNTCRCVGRSEVQSQIDQVTSACCPTTTFGTKILAGSFANGKCDYTGTSGWDQLTVADASKGFDACCRATYPKVGQTGECTIAP